LKFQRGDILHVISTSDENWWQAYREGDDPSSSLAGLIPSTHFQQQSVFQFSEMLTYEEVSLYMSKGTRKRPIVLCGPEGVGCLELRQRLVESDKSKFASAVPHTTRPKKSGELDDVHFHFVTRQKFQEDAKMGKFIEYGEYQKHLYGTSIAAIQSVVNRGKICLLTLKAEVIFLRTSLMPYVVFIAPPSLQQLKRQKESLGQFNVKEEQLKLTLNEGKLTEQVDRYFLLEMPQFGSIRFQEYGHLFDHIIVNIDLDRSLNEMKDIVRKLETEPQWVPSFWLNRPEANYYR
uniref:MAGUK p55 subfamily member 5 (inferred by orthology to a human protein) n=1 Tax=Anisakis simplex TaxID=6269 RepID=A0A0M3J211_ANISI